MREVDLRVPVPEGFEVPLTELTGEVALRGSLDGLLDGVLLRGAVTVSARQRCASCLIDLDPHTILVDVAEMYSDPADAEDPDDVEPAYAIVEGRIDIDGLLRDVLADAVPIAPRCRPDCAGLCPSCGMDLNQGACDCAEERVDDRWAALSDLELDG